jgi:hypothetical protein
MTAVPLPFAKGNKRCSDFLVSSAYSVCTKSKNFRVHFSMIIHNSDVLAVEENSNKRHSAFDESF